MTPVIPSTSSRQAPSRRRGIAILFLALFAVIAALVSTGATHDWDVATLQWFGSWRTPGLTSAMQFITNLGNWPVEVPLLLIIGAYLWRRGRRTNAWRYVTFCLGGEALYAIAKLLFHRERPTVITHLSDAGWYSYPSGHSMLAPIIWSAGLVLVSQLAGNRVARNLFVALAIVMPLMIATSRVYLGVHYLTDVLGGLALGMAWVMIWWDAVSRAPTAVAPTTQ